MNPLIATPRCLDAIDGVIYRRRLDQPSTVELPGNLQRNAARSIELIAQGQRPDGQIVRLQLHPPLLNGPEHLHTPLSCTLPVDFVLSLADNTELKLLTTVDGLEHASTSLRISDQQAPPSPRFPPLLTITQETLERVTLAWTPIIGAFDYQVEVSTDGFSIKYDTKWLFMELKKSDLPANKMCTVRVRARLAWWFYTEYSNSIWFSDVDRRVPKNLSVMVASARQAKIAWEVPDEAGPIEGYKVTLANGESHVTTALNYVLPVDAREARVSIVRDNTPMYDATIALRYNDKEPPARPKNFKYAMYSATAATFSWEANDNIGTQLHSFIREGVSNGLIGEPELDITGIEEGHKDSVEVIAIDAAGNRSLPGRAELSAKRYPPDMPILGDVFPSYYSITLNWTAQPRVEFEVTYYPTPNGEKKVVTTKNTTVFLDRLAGGVNFTFEIRAISQNGLSSDPAILTATIPKLPVPAKPIISVSQAGNFGIELAYQTPSADRYTIRHWLHGTDTVISVVTWEAQYTPYTLKPLIPGATYTIEITAFNESGASETASYTFTLEELVSEVQPFVNVLNNTDGSFILGWMTLFEYNAIEIVYGTADNPEMGRFITMDSYHEFTDLTPNTKYVFEVRRSNQLGVSPAQFIATTAGALDPRKPRNLKIVSPPQATHRSLTWTPPLDGLPDLQYVSDGEGAISIKNDVTSYTFATASSAHEHLSIVTATWDALLYFASVHQPRLDPVPQQPQVSAVCMGFHYVTLKWQSETGVEYEAFCRSNDPSALPSIKTPYNYCTFTDLVPGTTYTFDVHAYKNGVTSEPGTLSVRIYDQPLPETSAPRLVTSGADSITLSFPARYAEDYLITYRTAGSEPLSVTTALSTYRFEQLLPNAVYDFQITARNSAGDAEAAALSGKTESIVPNVQLVSAAPVLEIAWKSPLADRYELTWGIVNGETFGPSVVTKTSLRIENWVNHATYWFKVRAGISSVDYWSEVAELRHTQNEVTTPTFQAKILNGTLLVTWTSENAGEYLYYWRTGELPLEGPLLTSVPQHSFINPQPGQTYWVMACARKNPNNPWSDNGEFSYTLP